MDLGNVAQIGSFIVSLAMFVWVLVSARSKASNDKVAKLEGVVEGRASKSVVDALEVRMRDLERKSIEVDGALANMPDRDAAHRLELAIAKLEGRFDALDERLKPVAAIGDRLQEFLLEQAGRVRA